MKQLVENIAKSLVDKAEDVEVFTVEGDESTVLELKVAEGDMGRVIGKHGRTARSMRTVLGAAAMKANKRVTLDILE